MSFDRFSVLFAYLLLISNNYSYFLVITSAILLFLYFSEQEDSLISPYEWKTTSGSNITFYCNSSNGVIWYYQYFRSMNSLQIIHDDNNMFQRESVRYYDSGYYYCYGSYSNSSKHFIAMTQLNVHGK